VTSMRIRVYIANYEIWPRVQARFITIQAWKGRMSGNENKVIMRAVYHPIMNIYMLFKFIMIL
jgi:hypothetical protein